MTRCQVHTFNAPRTAPNRIGCKQAIRSLDPIRGENDQRWMMRSLIETAVLITGCGSAYAGSHPQCGTCPASSRAETNWPKSPNYLSGCKE